MNTIEQFNCLSHLGNQELRKSGKIEKTYTHGSYHRLLVYRDLFTF